MQLTKQTDFAFRTLLYLGRLPAGEQTNIQQVCDFYDISPNHISKVVVKLAKLGYINAVRGKGGGISLGMDPGKINLADVVIAFEPTLDLVNCEEPLCRIASTCTLRGMLSGATQAFLDALRQFTLADALGNRIKIDDEQVIEVK